MSHRQFLSIGAGLIALAAGAARAESLNDALVAAYLNNPTLAAQRASLRAVDETVSQAVAGWRPTVRLTGTAGDTKADTAATRESRLNPDSRAASVSQNLYSGGRTVSGIAKAEADVQAGRATLHGTEQTVLLQAATAYLDVLRDIAILDLNRGNVQVLTRQLEATQDRFRVGEITRTDVAQAEARLQLATSNRVQAEGNLISTRATYRRVMGELPGPLERIGEASGLPRSEDEAVALAVAEHPTLVTAVRNEDSAKHSVDVAEGALLPTLGLTGDWSHSNEASQRSTSARESYSKTTSALLTLTVPLYQSGSEYSTVRQSKQTAAQRRLQVEEARRTVVEGVTRAWEALNTARARIQSTGAQVRAAELALEGVREEANVGARTTLDVLDAEQELLNARVSLVTAQRDAAVASFTLKGAIGRLTASHMQLPVASYDPTMNYRGVRDRWIGLDIDASK
ncbi:MAG: TolC family outer membrane protein [Alphaproteobacteria bacterium]|nr:TolC family outer membrane protein [Alphaproteobacteria bacterium]